jgi:Acetyltransferase (GNAT) domain
VAAGRAEVVRELRAAGPLLARVRAPVPARPPWLTAVLNVQDPRRWAGVRPVAVVVERPGTGATGETAALAALVLRSRGPRVLVTLLGDGVGPAPPGTAPARMPVRDDATAAQLAAGVLDLVESLRRPWTLRLAGLPLGDPTTRELGRLRPETAFANARSAALVDDLDEVGPVRRSRDPRELERWLPQLLAREPDPRARSFLRAAARLHAAIGQLEVAVLADGGQLRAGLLVVDDGRERRPWWGFSDVGGLRREMGAPLVSVTLDGGRPTDRLSRRTGRR